MGLEWKGESDPPRLMVTIGEAGRMLSLSRASIYRLIDKGALERRRVLGRALITADSVRRVAEEGADNEGA